MGEVSRATVVAAVVFGLLSLIVSVAMTVGLFTGGWSADDPLGVLYVAAVIAGFVGPFVALWGVRELRHAEAEGRSADRGRKLIIVGTVGIALVGAAVFWTIIGPIIAVAIVVYWVRKTRDWQEESATP